MHTVFVQANQQGFLHSRTLAWFCMSEKQAGFYVLVKQAGFCVPAPRKQGSVYHPEASRVLCEGKIYKVLCFMFYEQAGFCVFAQMKKDFVGRRNQGSSVGRKKTKQKGFCVH